MGKRAEMRRDTRKKDPTYTLTLSQIERLKEDAIKEATHQAFILMIGIPVMVLHDKYYQLMKRDGREQRFVDLILDLYDSYDRGYVELEDLKKVLKDEAGINEIEFTRINRRI